MKITVNRSAKNSAPYPRSRAILNSMTESDGLSCYLTLRCVALRYVTLRYVTLRYVTLRYFTIYPIPSLYSRQWFLDFPSFVAGSCLFIVRERQLTKEPSDLQVKFFKLHRFENLIGIKHPLAFVMVFTSLVRTLKD